MKEDIDYIYERLLNKEIDLDFSNIRIKEENNFTFIYIRNGFMFISRKNRTNRNLWDLYYIYKTNKICKYIISYRPEDGIEEREKSIKQFIKQKYREKKLERLLKNNERYY